MIMQCTQWEQCIHWIIHANIQVYIMIFSGVMKIVLPAELGASMVLMLQIKFETVYCS